MNGESKIGSHHLSRQAYVYVRQSSREQVLSHPESARMQRELKNRAVALGWPSSRVRVLDGDLGKSGQVSTGREDFKTVVGDVCASDVGIILGIDASRLARNNADWFPLIEMCGLTGTLISDQHRVYDPNDPDDRLVLGVKGTISEAELTAIRSRLLGARWSLARRGQLRRKIPTGYVWDEQGRVTKDPDERVRGAFCHLFTKFQELGSGCAVARYYNAEGLLFPRRDPRGRWNAPVEWKPLTVRHATQILHNPFYAGAYFYGAYRSETRLDPETRTRKTVLKRQPLESWEVLIQEHHPAYISWEQFLRNRKRLKENRRMPEGGAGAPRSGAALLQGLAYCSRCGRRLAVRYWGRHAKPIYVCNSLMKDGTWKYCMSAPAPRIDRWVEEQVLKAVGPVGIEVALEAVEELERRSDELNRQWENRIKQCEYEADLARRRYETVDPANRLVASNLEGDWEEKLQKVVEAKREYEERSNQSPLRISPEDRERVRQLSKDIPHLWRSKATKQADRKKIVRILIREVWLNQVDEPRCTNVRILWQSGAVTEADIDRPWPIGVRSKTPEEVVDAVRELDAESRTPQQIAEELNQRGLRGKRGHRYNATMVRYLLRTRRIGRYHGSEETDEAR